MKICAILFALLQLVCIAVSAQKFKSEYSSPFEEPKAMESKVMQCANGNTFLFSFTKKDGIEIILFDKSRKITTRKTVQGKQWKTDEMAQSKVAGIYEINGQMVMFLEQLVGKVPNLYRLVFDENNGEAVSEENIASMPRYGSFDGYAMYFGGVEPKGFFVSKDPASDNYAVVSFDGFAEKTDRRIEVAHYNSKHEKISEAFFDSPDGLYKYINFLDMYVDGDKQLFLCTYAFNTKASGVKASKVYISKLQAGKAQVEHYPLQITQDFKSTRGIMEYNAGTKNIDLLIVSLKEKENAATIYNCMTAAIDPATLNVLYVKPLNTAKADEYGRINYGETKKFEGMPMNMVINPDNSTTVVMEELSKTDTYRADGRRISTSYSLQDIGIIDLDDKQEPKYGYSIQKSQTSSFPVPPLSLHEKANNSVTFDKNMMNMFGLGGLYTKSGFFSSDYMTGMHGTRFIIFNDLPENFDIDKKSQPKNLTGISNCNTICYQMSEGAMEKFYLFGKPNDGFDNRFALLSSSQYQSSSNTYAVMLVEKNGRLKQSYVAWIKLD